MAEVDKLSNDAQVEELFLKRWRVWKILFAWQHGTITKAEAAQLLGLSESDAVWVWNVAAESTKRLNQRQKNRGPS
jgi:hypothetical protein